MIKTTVGLLISLVILQALGQKADPLCSNVQCPVNFRCQEGVCLRQQKQAKPSTCFPMSSPHDLQAVRCTTRDYSCGTTTRFPTCGFSQAGLRKDFQDDCSPCLDPTIDYFYRLPCLSSPSICTVQQQCVNGACVEMFNGQNHRNLKICNKSSDCSIIEICAANKCVRKNELLSELRKGKSINQ